MIKQIALLFLIAETARAATVTLAWTASTSSDVSNYRIKWGFVQGGPYTHVVEAGATTTTTITEPWPLDTDVFFTAYAVNAAGESGPSNEVRFHTPAPTPTPSPTPAPTPAPPTNLQLFLQSLADWWRNFWHA